MRLILASSSPRRKELIGSLGILFEIIKPDIDETQHTGENPFDYVQRLSIEKAQAVADQIEGDAAILAADTIVVLAADTIGVAEDGELLGKPADAEEARTMLTKLRNRAHIVCTAFTLKQVNGKTITQMVKTNVYMRDYSDAEIEAYIATGDPFDKAGSYAIQHEEFAPVARIEGDRNNVIGLPLDAVKAALESL